MNNKAANTNNKNTVTLTFNYKLAETPANDKDNYTITAFDNTVYELDKAALVDNDKKKVILTLKEADPENTKTYIAGSIADMQSLLVDVDENVPKEEAAFQKVEDEKVRASCNFRKVCDSKTSS